MIVVTGATGNVGSSLIDRLSCVGHVVTGVSRRPPAMPWPPRARHHCADLGDPATLAPALEGASAMFLMVAGDLGAGPDPVELLARARRTGVHRVVLMSSQTAGTRPTAQSYGRLRDLEAAVRASGLEWTVLRPGGFATNSYAWAEQIRAHRTVVVPFGDTALPVIDPADIAACAAVVLLEPGHDQATYVLTGPQASTPHQRVQAISDAIGEPITFVEISRDEARQQMLAFMPPHVVEGTLDILGAPTTEEQQVGPDVEKLLGRPGTSFEAWARHHAAAFT